MEDLKVMNMNEDNTVTDVTKEVLKETFGGESGRSLTNAASDVAVLAHNAEGPLKTILTWALITAAVVGVAYITYRGVKYVIKKKKGTDGAKYEIQEIGSEPVAELTCEEQDKLAEKDAEIARLQAELEAKNKKK